MPTWVIGLIPALPLLGFLLNALLIRNERTAGLVASLAVGAGFIAALAAVFSLQQQAGDVKRLELLLWDWISTGTFRVPFGLLFDPLTAVMTLLITGVGTLIHVYSIGYMHGDPRAVRYFAYLNLFITMMLLLVMGNNLLLLFLGWEGVGLCSFLLIGHWFDRKRVEPGIVPAEAAVKAFVVNRIGDAGLMLAIFAIFKTVGSISYFPTRVAGQPVAGYLAALPSASFQPVSFGIFGSLTLGTAIGLLMLLAVTGKSAQVPLFTWLPDAMAGPTPVSALIHAATMVTAGVYLIVRNHTLFSAAPGAAGWVVTIGVLTALLGALAACAQFDIKRVLAYSTISQLGFMVAAAGVGAYTAAMFHLLTHGLFKALLFLAAGSVIHGTHETQDMRKFGGLREKLPTTFRTFFIGALALAGIFPLAGFWSKDEIIGYAWFAAASPGVALMLLVASIFTGFYVGRMLALTFWGKQREPSYTPHESGRSMTIPLWILAAGAVLGGLISLPRFFGSDAPGLDLLGHFLEPVLQEPPSSFTLGYLLLDVLVLACSGAAVYGGWYLYARTWASRIKVGKEDPLFRALGELWRGAELGWGFDWFYTSFIVRPYRRLAQFLSSVVDHDAIDGLLVNGSARAIGWFGGVLGRAQSGYIRSYALLFLFGVLLLVGYMIFRV